MRAVEVVLKDVAPVQEDFDILQKWNTLLSQVFSFIVEVAYLTYNAWEMWRLLNRCRHIEWNTDHIFLEFHNELWHCFCQSYNFIIPTRTVFCKAVWIAFKYLNVDYGCRYKLNFEPLTQISFVNLWAKKCCCWLHELPKLHYRHLLNKYCEAILQVSVAQHTFTVDLCLGFFCICEYNYQSHELNSTALRSPACTPFAWNTKHTWKFSQLHLYWFDWLWILILKVISIRKLVW